MSETDLVLLFTRWLERAGFTCMITGSVAGVFYGEPRVTHDVDLVLTRSDAPRIAELFPLREFYCPPEEIIIREVLRAQRGHFNLIHHESGFNADVYLANRDLRIPRDLPQATTAALLAWHGLTRGVRTTERVMKGSESSYPSPEKPGRTIPSTRGVERPRMMGATQVCAHSGELRESKMF